MDSILIVDDELVVRNLLMAIVGSGHYEVLEASNGEEALEVCRIEVPDLVVTDLIMPEKNGIDLILTLKKEFPTLPIVAISGGGGITGRYDYLEIADLVGAKCVLKKPFTKAELLDAIAAVLESTEKC